MDATHKTSCTLSAFSYFKKALTLLKQGENQLALQYIDSAILFSSNCPFYIYQKIKFLVHINPLQCEKYILSQLNFLYRHASLYITCRSLHYYVKLAHSTPEALDSILSHLKLPNILGKHYSALLTQSVASLIPFIEETMVHDALDECIAYCDLVLKVHPTYEEIYYSKGTAYHLLYDLPKAVSCYKKALQLNPPNAMLCNLIGLALMELGQSEEALDYLTQATVLKPDNLDYALHVAECYYSTKKYKEAQVYLEDVRKRFPESLQTVFSLSHTYRIQNRKFLSNHYNRKIRKQLKKQKLISKMKSS
ncbi:tetratricopeptide repeat protein [Sporanaerobium hydrogeniformans]|uniref:tetratricopeptide repeat protein n=1 Tax=Sporanaerobium hydrogeniformans TaxID=3072179 RepID=UPI0015D4F0A1|nr:tetratricopeptide repeat protein [Sporanaerobium hydrogeniformans]